MNTLATVVMIKINFFYNFIKKYKIIVYIRKKLFIFAMFSCRGTCRVHGEYII